jgi:hypothetical protein
VWGGELTPLVLRSSDVTNEINREPLRIVGLKRGIYVLKIDGEMIGTFNNDELTDGVNLAILDTPMSKQAKEVYDLTVAHCDVHYFRWRTVEVPLAKYGLSASGPAMNAADSLEKELMLKRSSIAQPKSHKFVLVPIS